MKNELRSAFNTRQYMLSEDFEIYYYSDLHFQSVRPHAHDYYEFYILIEGDAAIEIGNQQIPLKKGSIALIPPGIPHRSVVSSDSDVPYRRFVFWVSKNYSAKLMHESPDYVYLMQQAATGHQYVFQYTSNGFNLILSKILRLLEEIHGNRYGRSAAISLCAGDLLLSLNRSVYEDAHPHEFSRHGDLFQNLTLYIEQHLDETLTLDHLAAQFYVSKYYIAHYFSKNIGLSIHQYIMKKRLAACRDTMLAGTPATQAFQSFGFKDYSSFFRAFRKEYGMSPKEYAEVFRYDVASQ